MSKIKEITNCHDCGKELKKGDKITSYDLGDEGVFYKCESCFEKKEHLTGFRKVECYTRCVGYIRPIDQFNPGKAEEVKDRKMFKNV